MKILTNLKRKTFSDIYLYFFSFLYPILPQYCTIKNIYAGRFLVLFAFVTLIFSDQIRSFRFTKTRVLISVLALGTFIVPMIANGELLTTGAMHYISIRYLMIIYYIIMLDTDEKRNTVLNIFFISGILLAVTSFSQLFGFNIFSLVDNYTGEYQISASSGPVRWGLHRLSSSLGNAISFGIYLTFIVSICFYKLTLINRDPFGKKNVAYILIISFLDIAILFTLSKAAIFFAGVLHLLYLFKLDKISQKIFLGAFCLAGAGCLVLYFLNVDVIVGLWNNFLEIFFHYASVKNDSQSTYYYRLNLYDRVKNMLGEQTLFGLGRCYTPYSYYYVSNGTSWWYRIMWSYDNFYLDTLLKQGIWGLACVSVQYLITLIIFFVGAIKKDKFSFFAFATVAVYLLNLISIEGLYEGRLFYPLVGLFFSYYNMKRDGKQKNIKRIA